MSVEKDINLIPQKNVNKNRVHIKLSVAAGLIGLIVVFTLAYVMPKMETNRLYLENNRVIEELKSRETAGNEVDSIDAKKAKLEKMKESYKAITLEKVMVLEFLKKLSGYIPENVSISNLSMANGESLSVTFATINPIDTVKLIVKLKEMDIFESVELASIPIGEAPYSLSFNLRIKGKSAKGK